jgi:hypothetical protein
VGFAKAAASVAGNPKLSLRYTALLCPVYISHATQHCGVLFKPCVQVRDLVAQANRLGAALEDASDENAALRKAAGMAPGAAVDASGVRMAREVALAQLRSVNALLERQVRAVAARDERPMCQRAAWLASKTLKTYAGFASCRVVATPWCPHARLSCDFAGLLCHPSHLRSPPHLRCAAAPVGIRP